LTARDSSAKNWGQLNVKQKIVRTTSTGASLVTILAGVLVTGTVFTLLYTEVLAPDSTANWFNRAVSRIKDEPRCLALLGTASSIKAYGEPTSNRWARNRPIASNHNTDRNGVEHLRIRFNVEGNVDRGVVHIHLVKRPESRDFEYKYLYLDVPGQSRLYLEDNDDKDSKSPQKKGIFGVSWGW
ncbi:TIM21-domain-containing protein, partial [Peziza echinospora]